MPLELAEIREFAADFVRGQRVHQNIGRYSAGSDLWVARFFSTVGAEKFDITLTHGELQLAIREVGSIHNLSDYKDISKEGWDSAIERLTLIAGYIENHAMRGNKKIDLKSVQTDGLGSRTATIVATHASGKVEEKVISETDVLRWLWNTQRTTGIDIPALSHAEMLLRHLPKNRPETRYPDVPTLRQIEAQRPGRPIHQLNEVDMAGRRGPTGVG